MPKSALAPAVAPSPLEFAPPPVEVGQVVLWSYGPGDKLTSPALVLVVATQTLTVAVHVNGVKDHVLKTGVRHKDDPTIHSRPPSDQGVWGLTSRDKQLNVLLAERAAYEE